MDQISYADMMNAFKKLMKTRKLGYARLGASLKIPESTLKKWFTAKDGSWERIAKIAGALGISMTDLIKSVENTRVTTLTVPAKVQAWFQADAVGFKVYWMLVYERTHPDEIKSRLRLTSPQLKSYLLKLDRLGLIDFTEKEQPLLPALRPVRWSPEGMFVKTQFRDWSLGVLKAALQSPERNFILQHFQLSDASSKELCEDIKKLEEKFARRTIFELNDPETTTHRIRFLNCVADGGFFD
jgi:hypothetical protein